MDHSLPSSSVYGILQARILEWIVIPCSRDLPDPRIEPTSPALAGRFSTIKPPGKAIDLNSGLQYSVYHVVSMHAIIEALFSIYRVQTK